MLGHVPLQPDVVEAGDWASPPSSPCPTAGAREIRTIAGLVARKLAAQRRDTAGDRHQHRVGEYALMKVQRWDASPGPSPREAKKVGQFSETELFLDLYCSNPARVRSRTPTRVRSKISRSKAAPGAGRQRGAPVAGEGGAQESGESPRESRTTPLRAWLQHAQLAIELGAELSSRTRATATSPQTAQLATGAQRRDDLGDLPVRTAPLSATSFRLA